MMSFLKFIANDDAPLFNVLRLLLLVEYVNLLLECLEIVEKGWSSNNPALVVEIAGIYITHYFLSNFEKSVSTGKSK
jgi:hypothetical protein